MRRRGIAGRLALGVALGCLFGVVAPGVALATPPTSACDATNPFDHLCVEVSPAPAAHAGDEVSVWVTLCNESDVAFLTTVVTTVNAPDATLFATTRFRSFLAAGECGAAVRSVSWTVRGDDLSGHYRTLVVAHPAKDAPASVRLGPSKVLAAEKVHVPTG